jgi:Flp pilus assembly protein TadG
MNKPLNMKILVGRLIANPANRITSDEKGVVVVLVVLSMVVMLGFLGLTVDVGSGYIQKQKLQNALDAAVLAGIQALPADTAQARSDAIALAGLNGVNLEPGDITISHDCKEITCNKTLSVPLFFGAAFGVNEWQVSGNATAAVTTSSEALCFDYTVFSGSTSQSLLLDKNNADIDGTVHTNQNLVIDGNNNTVTGACEAVGIIDDRGNNNDIRDPRPGSAYVAMPDYSALILQQAQAAGRVVYGDTTFNEETLNVNSPIYVYGNVTINGNHISGVGTILATGSITVTGNKFKTNESDEVCLYSANGNITFNKNDAVIYGIIYAPNGTITFEKNNPVVHGRIVGSQVVFLKNDAEVYDLHASVTSLPVNRYKLVQ